MCFRDDIVWRTLTLTCDLTLAIDVNTFGKAPVTIVFPMTKGRIHANTIYMADEDSQPFYCTLRHGQKNWYVTILQRKIDHLTAIELYHHTTEGCSLHHLDTLIGGRSFYPPLSILYHIFYLILIWRLSLTFNIIIAFYWILQH